jgi:hypothetical protein
MTMVREIPVGSSFNAKASLKKDEQLYEEIQEDMKALDEKIERYKKSIFVVLERQTDNELMNELNGKSSRN